MGHASNSKRNMRFKIPHSTTSALRFMLGRVAYKIENKKRVLFVEICNQNYILGVHSN